MGSKLLDGDIANREVLRLLDARRAILARTSLTEFCALMSPEEQPAAHHRLINAALERVEAGETKRLLITMPPGSAKSRYASVRFPAWFFGRNPKKQIIVASHTAELAEGFGRQVRNSMADDRYAQAFTARVSDDNAAAHRWATAEGGTYVAVGVGSALVGRRADVAIIDDPVAGREQADSELVRARAWNWWLQELVPRLKPTGAVVLIMQRWHEDDLAGRLLDDMAKGGEKWEVLCLPMEAESDDDPLGRKIGEPLWPEWYTDAMRAQAKSDPRTWSALYQQRPTAGTGGEFKREWLMWAKSVKADGLNVYMTVDAANGKRANNDYTSIWVIGLGEDGNYHVLDMIRDRLNLTERAEAVFRLHRKWKPLAVLYERYGMMADIQHIEHLQSERNYRFTIVEVAGKAAKVDRIRRLIPLFQAGRVWVPMALHYTDSTGTTRELVRDFIEQEFLAFPVGRHDDMIDALARIAEPEYDFHWPKASHAKRKPLKINYGSVR